MFSTTCAGSRAGVRAALRYAATHDIQPLASRTFSSSQRTQHLPSRISTDCGNTTRLRNTTLNPTQRHAFSTTAPVQKTIYLTEPREDPEGKEMSIEITPRAAKVSHFRISLLLKFLANAYQRLSEIIKVSNDPSFALRVQVQSGGCHGFQYLTTNASIKSLSSLEEDESVFGFVEDDAPSPEASAEEQLGGPKIVLDEPSLVTLRGSKIDYTQELIGSKFEVVDNPAADNSCGCGSSFSLKL